MTRYIYRAVVLAVMIFLPCTAYAQTEPFDQWLQGLAQEAVADGVSSQTVQQALSGLALDEDVIELDRKQPEKTIAFDAYLRNVLTAPRLKKGLELADEHRSLLRNISAQYGVPTGMIVALWGVESSFGRNGGNNNVVSSLATLAYEGRRADFFRGELMEALRLLDEEKMDPSLLLGSWAGAMGQCQFMPSTFRHYAADYNGDGRRNIWDEEADVFASIANYLVAEGWQSDQNWGREVRLSRGLPEGVTGLEQRRTLAEWGRLGVRTRGRKPLPASGLKASLIQPDGPGGRSFLVYDNFRALMRWNHSTYFATAVGLLADQLSSTH
ncbi:MAG: lytic murein transglycosylase [Alphaproteobacteria bacterium]|nr:lytic murein transglycosylase [Alphaproteobacteria bacterium]